MNLREVGYIKIYKNSEGFQLTSEIDAGEGINEFIGLEGIGETFFEALEDLYTSAELVSIGE